MRKMLLVLLTLAVALGGLSLWAAAPADVKPLKPVVVVALPSYDKVMGDIAFVGKLSDNPDLAKGLEALLKFVTKNQGLAGLDKSKPLGVAIETDGAGFTGYAFVPVTDLKKLLTVLEPFVGKAEPQADGVTKIPGKGPKGKPVYIREGAPGWIIACDRAERLVEAPADPLPMLTDLNKQYDLAVRLYAGNVPAAQRQQFIAKMKADVQRDWQKRWGETDAQQAARQKIGQEILSMVLTLVDDADQVTLGWGINEKFERTYVDLNVTAREGTETARQMAQLGQAKSNFSGFRLPGATLCGNWAGTMPAGKAELLGQMIDGLQKQALADLEKAPKSDEERRVAKELINDVSDLLSKSLRSGRIDGGMAVLLSPKSATALAGGYIADGDRLDKVAKTITAVAEQQNPVISDFIKLDAEKLADVRLHTLRIPIPFDANDREKLVALVGEELDVVVGIGKESVYLATGRDALKTLKQAIERSGAAAYRSATVPPMHFSLDVYSIADFIATMGKPEERPKAALVAAELKKTPGADHVTIEASPIARGIRYRIELEDGLVKLIGRLSTLAGS